MFCEALRISAAYCLSQCRKKESSFEAQLDTSVFKSAHHISGGRIIYLGLYSCKPDCADSVYDALERATRTVDRTKVKLLEGCMSATKLEGQLQVCLSPVGLCQS